jgi:hypothetical protein
MFAYYYLKYFWRARLCIRTTCSENFLKNKPVVKKEIIKTAKNAYAWSSINCI